MTMIQRRFEWAVMTLARAANGKRDRYSCGVLDTIRFLSGDTPSELFEQVHERYVDLLPEVLMNRRFVDTTDDEPLAYMDETQAAEYLNLAASTLQSWRSANIGPAFVKFSRNLIRYRQEDLDVWAAARVQHTLEST